MSSIGYARASKAWLEGFEFIGVRSCLAARRGLMALTAVLLTAGCSADIIGSRELTWHRFPRYQRVHSPCTVVLASSVSSYVTVATQEFWTYRLHFGDSLRANVPQALSKLFDAVDIVTQASGEELPDGTTLLSITSISAVVSPPVGDFGKGTADLVLSGEIRTNKMDQPLTWRVRGRGRSLSDSGWPGAVLNGSVEQALNELTRFISTSPLGASPE